MGTWFHHWILIDFWDLVWPNLAASLIVFIFVYLKVRSVKKLNEELKELHLKHHHELKEAVAQVTGTSSPAILENGGDLW